MISNFKYVFLCGFWFILLPLPVFAYVDPGSGSIIITTILGVLGAVAFTFRKLFYNIRGFLRKLISRKSSK
jgi:hypothetical protein